MSRASATVRSYLTAANRVMIVSAMHELQTPACQRIDPPSSGHGSTESALARQFGTGAAIHRDGLVRQAALLFPG